MKDEALKSLIQEVKAAGGHVPEEVIEAVNSTTKLSNSSPKN